MSYVYYNPNPLKLSVGDCTIRAISRALHKVINEMGKQKREKGEETRLFL